MTNTLTISRELAERLTNSAIGFSAKMNHWRAVEQLRALIAAPAIERQEPMLDEQAEFYSWCTTENIDPKTEVGFMMWEAWQARACLDKVKELNK